MYLFNILVTSFIAIGICDGALLPPFESYKEVYVSSEKPAKLGAVAEAVRSFGHGDIKPKGERVESGVPEQPLRRRQTRQGAKHRMEELQAIVLPKSHAPGLILLVSIESGIMNHNGDITVETVKQGKCFDFAVIILEEYDNGRLVKMHMVDSAKVFIPGKEIYYKYLLESWLEKEQTVTFGSLIENANGWKSWHDHIPPQISRETLLTNAVKKGLEQMSLMKPLED